MMAFSAPPPLTSAALNKMTRIVPGARAERQKTQKNEQGRPSKRRNHDKTVVAEDGETNWPSTNVADKI